MILIKRKKIASEFLFWYKHVSNPMQVLFVFDIVENIHDKVEYILHLQQIRKTSGCIPKAN